MKKARNIHSLDTLEREIYRLKLEAKNIEQKLGNNLDHLQENYFSMSMNSLFCRDENKKGEENGFWKSFFKNEGFTAAANTVASNIAQKAAEGFNNWMNNFFEKKKSSSE